MNRIIPTITTLAQHFSALAKLPDVYRPRCCPYCGFGRFWQYGCYQRKADRRQASAQSLNPVPVKRYYCHKCSRTCSRLPEWIAPRRWYNWAVQHRALHRLVCGWALRRTCAHLRLARHTVRRWRDWLIDRSLVAVRVLPFICAAAFPIGAIPQTTALSGARSCTRRD